MDQEMEVIKAKLKVEVKLDVESWGQQQYYEHYGYCQEEVKWSSVKKSPKKSIENMDSAKQDRRGDGSCLTCQG